MTALLDAALAELPRAAREPKFPPSLAPAAAAALLDAYTRLTPDDPTPALARVAAARGDAGAAAGAADLLAGRCYLLWAGRDRDRAREVAHDPARAGRFKSAMADHLAAAQAALTRAAAADPADPAAAELLIRHADLADLPADVMTKWYARAVEAYPVSLAAAQAKMAFLYDHVLYGDAAAFARECLAGEQWSARIPLVAADFHLWRANFFGKAPNGAYLARDDAWADVWAAFDGYLRRYPGAVRDRTAYARAACLAGKWDVAAAQFDLLGDRAAVDVFHGQAEYDYYRRKARRLTAGPQN
jgi:hypothetical protein